MCSPYMPTALGQIQTRPISLIRVNHCTLNTLASEARLPLPCPSPLSLSQPAKPPAQSCLLSDQCQHYTSWPCNSVMLSSAMALVDGKQAARGNLKHKDSLAIQSLPDRAQLMQPTRHQPRDHPWAYAGGHGLTFPMAQAKRPGASWGFQKSLPSSHASFAMWSFSGTEGGAKERK